MTSPDRKSRLKLEIDPSFQFADLGEGYALPDKP
jgi:hypothetical protein